MTERQVSLQLYEAGEKRIAERQALPGKLYSPDIARLTQRLACDDSRICAEQAFSVDRGWT